MKLSLTCLVALLCAPFVSAQTLIMGPEGDCGFSKYKPHTLAHFVERGAGTKVTPQYPLSAKVQRISGTVLVRVLIDKEGLVRRTCPVYTKGTPRPDRSLVVAAEAAALQWKFQPRFGTSPGDELHFEYVEGLLTFQFAPD